MTSRITLWGRNDDPDSRTALRFLRDNGFDADRVLDIDRRPPTPSERRRIEGDFGRALPDPVPAPLLLTPKGALVGFRERRWRRFLGLDDVHDA